MYRTTLFLVTAALLLSGSRARAQVAAGGGNTVRVRVATTRDSVLRIRRERLLLRFDSLRYVFENDRMGDAERERVANEMHRTVMALQESLDDVGAGASAMTSERASRSPTADGMQMSAPEIAIAMQEAFGVRGYLGVSFDGPSIEEVRRGGERIMRFLDYPRIALVEPSSPAERAGIAEGDTLLAFNGTDVRERQISLSKLLIPDRRILIRVRRDGAPKDFRVRVDQAPGYVMSRRMAPMTATAVVSPAMPFVPMPSTPVRVYPGEDLPRRAPMAPVAVGATPRVAGSTSVWVMTDGVGGAKLETINQGLARTIGVKSGVLVLRVGPGTPAYDSGLRDGDVILRAAGQSVGTVRELRALVERDNEDGVKLVIRRDRKQREVTLRW